MVMSCLAGPKEAAAMWSAPVNEVIMVLEGFDALLCQQCELTDCPVVAVVSVQKRVEGGERLSFKNPIQNTSCSSSCLLKPPH